MADDSIETTPTPTHHQFDSNTYRKSKSKPSVLSKFLDEKPTIGNSYQPNSSMQSEKSKPRPYLFGGTFSRSSNNKIDSEKENVHKDDDRFKTITVNSLRRSFRDSFLESSKPAKGREHQPIWFIDVKDDKNAKKNNDTAMAASKRSIRRHDTFRVEKEPPASGGPSVGRRDTFRINDRDYMPPSASLSLEYKRSPSVDSNQSARRSLAPIRVDILNSSVGSDRSGKMVPVGVAAPYSALNDIADQSGKYSRPPDHHSSRTESQPNVRTRTQNSLYEDDSYRPNATPKNSNYSSSPEYTYRPPERRSATYSPSRKLVNEKASQDSPDAIKITQNHRSENKFISARQSFRELNLAPERTLTSRPTYRIGSFRSAVDSTPKSSSAKYFGDDEQDTGRPYSSNAPQNDFDRNDWPHQSWRNISSRAFSRENDNNDEPENRSFVPYYNYNKYSNHQNDPPTKNAANTNQNNNNNNNRTTINIDYNYNLSPTKTNHMTTIPTNALTNDHNNDPILKRRTEPIETTPPLLPLPTLKPAKQKEKSSKNRSVNFPSVEYEVRLISPNYDTKPRRKDSWKSKPANDWTFNKVHL